MGRSEADGAEPSDPTPLRVLLVTEASSAGVGRHTIDLALGLLELGCHVHLLYSSGRIDEPFRQGLAELGAARTTEIEMRRGPHLSDVRARRDLDRCLRRQGPFDVVHGHSSKAGLITRMARTDAALVYTPHCIYTMNPEARWAMQRATLVAERLLATRSDAIIAVSPDEERHLLEIGMRRSLVRYIPNGLREPRWSERSAARAELGLSDEQVVVGFLGRLSEQKNPTMLLEAFARCRRGRPELRLCIVGDGPLEEETHRVARALGVQEAVLWTGHRTPQRAMPAFDVFALSSRYEAMPYVLLEALAAGLPIVATPVGGTGVTVEPGENGSIAAGLGAEEFAAALAPVLGDAPLRRAQGARSRAKAPAFSATTMVRSTHELYRGLVRARRS